MIETEVRAGLVIETEVRAGLVIETEVAGSSPRRLLFQYPSDPRVTAVTHNRASSLSR